MGTTRLCEYGRIGRLGSGFMPPCAVDVIGNANEIALALSSKGHEQVSSFMNGVPSQLTARGAYTPSPADQASNYGRPRATGSGEGEQMLFPTMHVTEAGGSYRARGIALNSRHVGGRPA